MMKQQQWHSICWLFLSIQVLRNNRRVIWKLKVQNLKTEKEYKEFLDYLFSIRDIEYRDFNTKIVVPVDCEIIGIRTPILRDIAKKIAKTSSENFLNFF